MPPKKAHPMEKSNAQEEIKAYPMPELALALVLTVREPENAQEEVQEKEVSRSEETSYIIRSMDETKDPHFSIMASSVYRALAILCHPAGVSALTDVAFRCKKSVKKNIDITQRQLEYKDAADWVRGVFLKRLINEFPLVMVDEQLRGISFGGVKRRYHEKAYSKGQALHLTPRTFETFVHDLGEGYQNDALRWMMLIVITIFHEVGGHITVSTATKGREGTPEDINPLSVPMPPGLKHHGTESGHYIIYRLFGGYLLNSFPDELPMWQPENIWAPEYEAVALVTGEQDLHEPFEPIDPLNKSKEFDFKSVAKVARYMKQQQVKSFLLGEATLPITPEGEPRKREGPHPFKPLCEYMSSSSRDLDPAVKAKLNVVKDAPFFETKDLGKKAPYHRVYLDVSKDAPIHKFASNPGGGVNILVGIKQEEKQCVGKLRVGEFKHKDVPISVDGTKFNPEFHTAWVPYESLLGPLSKCSPFQPYLRSTETESSTSDEEGGLSTHTDAPSSTLAHATLPDRTNTPTHPSSSAHGEGKRAQTPTPTGQAVKQAKSVGESSKIQKESKGKGKQDDKKNGGGSSSKPPQGHA